MNFRVSFEPTGDWPRTLPGPVGGNHLATGDLDGDAEREIVVADRTGHLSVFNPDGSHAWNWESGEAFASLEVPLGVPLVADLNGDGVADVVVPGDDGRIFGFAGPDGAPMGEGGSGVLVTSSNPMPGVELFGADLNPSTPGVEFGFGGSVQAETGLSRVEIYGVSLQGRAVRRGVASLHAGSGELPAVVADVDGDGRLELVASVRSGAPDSLRGAVELYNFDFIPGTGYVGGVYATAPLPDTAFYSAPVVGDLDRNGRLDVVVTSSNGKIYALEMDVDGAATPGFHLLPGWPRDMFASGADQVSLADIDRNGYLEVLALETGGVFHIFNYHGESLVSLPETVPAEVRYFVEPQLAPLVSDLTADGYSEVVLPLPDGQIIGVDSAGKRLEGWNYFGGGTGGASPVLEDLDGDGNIELITAYPWLDQARIEVHTLGRSAGPPTWGAHRGSSARTGQLILTEEEPVVNGPTLTDSFAMPNPARETMKFHYRVGAGVESVGIDLFDVLGRPVRTLVGTNFPGSDNIVSWDLTGADGQPVAPGVYLARIHVEGGAVSGESMLKLAVLR
jgi:hypothetical protein